MHAIDQHVHVPSVAAGDDQCLMFLEADALQ